MENVSAIKNTIKKIMSAELVRLLDVPTAPIIKLAQNVKNHSFWTKKPKNVYVNMDISIIILNSVRNVNKDVTDVMKKISANHV